MVGGGILGEGRDWVTGWEKKGKRDTNIDTRQVIVRPFVVGFMSRALGSARIVVGVRCCQDGDHFDPRERNAQVVWEECPTTCCHCPDTKSASHLVVVANVGGFLAMADGMASVSARRNKRACRLPGVREGIPDGGFLRCTSIVVAWVDGGERGVFNTDQETDQEMAWVSC